MKQGEGHASDRGRGGAGGGMQEGDVDWFGKTRTG